jgi:hypothetical protein
MKTTTNTQATQAKERFFTASGKPVSDYLQGWKEYKVSAYSVNGAISALLAQAKQSDTENAELIKRICKVCDVNLIAEVSNNKLCQAIRSAVIECLGDKTKCSPYVAYRGLNKVYKKVNK